MTFRLVVRLLRARTILSFIALAGVPGTLRAAEHWISLTTSHFEMYTTNGEKQAAEALQTFEQVRYFFEHTGSSKTVPEVRVRIVAFKSEKEYKPYRPNEGTFAYYQRGRKCDYIVMQDISAEHHQAAVHEYTHLVVEHLGLRLPVWLNEGIADVYSSLEPHGQKAMVGRPLPQRFIALAQLPWIDLSVLFAVDRNSPYYNATEKMSIFYAQSWALTHMLMLGDGYSPQFAKFLVAVSNGKSSAEALASVYGKSPSQVESDLRQYVQRATVRASVFDIKLAKSDLDPSVSDVSELQSGLVLADLLTMRAETAGEAQSRLTALAKEYPDSPDVEESLGYLAWQQGRVDDARKYFGMALRQHSNDAEMIYHYAQLQQSAGASNVEVIGTLKQVLTLKPDDFDARLHLGLLSIQERQYGFALSTLAQIKIVKPDRAYTLFSAMAYCLAQLGDLRGAKTYGEQAKQYAKNPNERFQAENFLASVERGGKASASEPRVTTRADMSGPEIVEDSTAGVRRAEGLPRVQGFTKSFECAVKNPRLHVQVGAREMIFEIVDPKLVVVRNAQNGSVEWSCGALREQPVTVVYSTSGRTGSIDGQVRELIF